MAQISVEITRLPGSVPGGNQHASVAAFSMAALLTLLALVTLGLKTALEWRFADQLAASGRH